MNEATYHAEQIKALNASQTETIDSNTVVTGMHLSEGSYHVLSRYGDDVWWLPDPLFAAGVRDNQKKLDFSRVPPAFKGTLKACTARYLLTGIDGRPRPRGGTVVSFFTRITVFLQWLDEQGIDHLQTVTTLRCLQYVDFCGSLTNMRGQPLSSSCKERRFNAIQTLYILSQSTADAMPHPWPESSATHLAGRTGPNHPRLHGVITQIIPDSILGPMFSSAVGWLDRADEILTIRDQIQCWMEQGHSYELMARHLNKLGWTMSEARAAEQHLQSACMAIILTTSGIRVSELCSLRNGCAYTTQDEQGDFFNWMRGTSYKTGEGACEWLVSEVTHRAIAVAERVAKPFQERLARALDELRVANPKDHEITRLSDHADRLFLVVMKQKHNRIETLANASVVTRLNGFAAQRGLDWRFTPHQFRRTFAVYAAHSALGDIRYLRDHYKHWSLDMTGLYAMNRKQDAELYDELGAAALRAKLALVEHWLEPDAVITGGAADQIRSFRTHNAEITTKEDRAEMAKTLSPLVHVRATGVAWCTADTGGCNGGQGVERTRCSDCSNAIIDASRMPVWRGIYAQQLELRDLADIGPGGRERVERDIKRCETVLKELGATEEGLADVGN